MWAQGFCPKLPLLLCLRLDWPLLLPLLVHSRRLLTSIRILVTVLLLFPLFSRCTSFLRHFLILAFGPYFLIMSLLLFTPMLCAFIIPFFLLMFMFLILISLPLILLFLPAPWFLSPGFPCCLGCYGAVIFRFFLFCLQVPNGRRPG